MSVVSLFLPNTNARDIHLLPGLVSPRLDHLVWIEDTTGNRRADHPPAGVSIAFFSQFIGWPSGHGVTVNEATGEIEIASPLPAGPRLHSFIVECSSSEGAQHSTTRIRVHVHEAVTRMWLSPSVLHVREGAENMRFGVLARFDDGVIGDITNWSPFDAPNPGDRTFVRRQADAVPVLSWSSPHPDQIAIDERTGVLSCKSAGASESITVQRRPLPASPDRQATAQAVGAPPWSTSTRAIPVQGKGFAGMGASRNILFLPDGFTNAESREFSRLVRGIVTRLTCRPQTRPFDLLSQSKAFNYFMAWVPSPEAGITVLNELDRSNPAGIQYEGSPLELPVPGYPNAPAWGLQELFYEIGLPTPVHDQPGSPLGTAAAGRLHDWRELHGEHITSALVSGAYPDWLDRSDRVLLNDKDTAFHLAISDRPRIDGFGTERDLTFNRLRLNEADFDRFLGALTDDKGNVVGNGWVTGGGDDDLVVFLCRSNRNAGTNVQREASGHYLAVSLGQNHYHHLQENIPGDGYDVVEDPIPADVPMDLWITVAHELAHSWTLKDEYGGGGVIGNNRADELKDFANVQPRKTLLTGANLDADKIKWRWPRIEKAGVLAALPTDQSGGGAGPFRVQLRKNHGYPFGRGDIVRLRTRPLLTAATSDRLVISRMLADGDLVELTLLPGSTLKVADFPAESVLILPRRAPDNPDGSLGDDLELVHTSVRARINATRNPLSAADGDPANRPCPGVKLPTPTAATNFPGGVAPKPPLYSSWIVGLHENGDGFDCEVYHPSGVCIMRTLTFSEPRTGRQRAYEFCPVCRYVMVDLFDPSRHGIIDADYNMRYPK